MLKLFYFLVLLSFSLSLNYDPGKNLVINIESNQSNQSDLVYMQTFEAPSKSLITFELRSLNKSFLSYVVFQLHSFHMNVSLSPDVKFGGLSQDGTNLGLVLKPDNFSKTLYLWNDNYDDVKCLVAVIVYNHSAPIPGGCSSGSPSLLFEEDNTFITVHTPRGKSSDVAAVATSKSRCSSNATELLMYFTYFIYLEQMNFSPDVYFEGIRKLMFTGIETNGYQTKQVNSQLKQYFEKTKGTGLVVNTVITDINGQRAYYVPSVTYSCSTNTWDGHCIEQSALKRSFGALLVLYSAIMILNLVMPELVESSMNGMLLGSIVTLAMIKNHHMAMSSLNIFTTTLFGAFIGSAIFSTISLYFRIGRYLTKLAFSNLVMAIAWEILFERVTSVYMQLGCAFIISIGFHFIKISFAVFHGGLLFIMSLSYLLKVGNVHRVVMNNFHALTSLYEPSTQDDESLWDFTRTSFINYKLQLGLFDFALITFYVIGSIFLTIRKEIYFRENPNILDAENMFSACENVNRYNRSVARNRRQNCWVGIRKSSMSGRLTLVSRCRRRHHYRSNVIHERSPLISHWLESDESVDDVFESPNSNSRFMRTLSSESKERIDAIQNFHN